MRTFALILAVSVLSCSRTALDLDDVVSRDAGGFPVRDGALDGSGLDASPPSGRADSGAAGASGTSDASSGDGTGAEPTIASNYLINPAHTGAIDDRTLLPPLVKLWERKDYSRVSSYPVIVNGVIYAFTGAIGGLTAYDARTGNVVWGPVYLGPGLYAFGAHAYDGGRIFAVNSHGQTRAFDAATGAPQWTRNLSASEDARFLTPPTAYRGMLYVSSDSMLFALDESTGAVRWSNEIGVGGGSSPGVNDDGVFVAQACPQAYRFDRTTGDALWKHLTQYCDGGGGATPALYRGRFYDEYDHRILDAASGADLGYFDSSWQAAFHNGRMFSASGLGLQSIDVVSSKVAWSVGGVGGLPMPPVVANGYVYFVSDWSTVIAVDESTGQRVWSDSIDVFASEAFWGPPGIGVAEGVLFVPTLGGFAVYASAPTVTDAGAGEAGVTDAGLGDAQLDGSP